MKWFIHILTLYFSVLAFLPCSDATSSTCCQDRTTCEQSSPSKEDAGGDHCPTFCFCSCCGTTFVFTAKKLSSPQFSPKQPSTTCPLFYQAYFGLAFQSDIWQPPQLL